MMRKSLATVLGIAVLLTSGVATADHRDNSFYDQAEVIAVEPIYEHDSGYAPREHCWDERTYHERRSDDYDYLPTITGAIIGGVIGNQFGKGRGRDALTVAGALLGGAVGHSIGNDDYHVYPSTQRNCEYRDDYREYKQPVGYRVKYRYKGNVFHTRTREHPGRWMRIRVTVDPQDGMAGGWLPDRGYRDSDQPFWYQEEPRREVWW
jgi:uncharacterized protein YcfJ